jgi:subtilisin family serine protease
MPNLDLRDRAGGAFWLLPAVIVVAVGLQYDDHLHGTHLAGIIGARDSETPAGKEHESRYLVGIAPAPSW